jgi:2-C-methyl-D-erythritol 4-phosphate cytidylyltransferase
MELWTIVVAAGSGSRFGAPKQFAPLGDRRVVDHSVETALKCSSAVVVVIPPDTEWDGTAVDAAVPGGATRAESVRAGLAAVGPAADVVLVHDAARPLASEALFRRVAEAIGPGVDGCIPGVAVADTIKTVEGDRVVATLPRDALVAVQTPQGFTAAALRAAHAAGGEGTDDAALVEANGGVVVVVPGEATNLKVTGPDDLARLEAALGGAR